MTVGAATIELTEAGFDEALAAHPRLVVDFWATWCGPCRAIAPVLETIAREAAGRVVIGKVNVDEQRGLAARFEIRSIPTLLFFKDGQAVDTVIGAAPRHEIDKRLASLGDGR
jgi:thioredoxin 1